jgi:hypothetical protein
MSAVEWRRGLRCLPGVTGRTARDGKSELELILDSDDAIGGIINTLTTIARILNLQKREPTLEDVFVDWSA